jgi:hypothetical protein
VKRARVGDIVEISTPAGFGYVQYTHEGGSNGELVRVLPGLYENSVSDFAVLARQKELYFIFYILNFALRAGEAEVVSNQPIPSWAITPPRMRHAATVDDFGRIIRWRIVSAASKLTPAELIRTPLITELTSDQKELSIREIWPHKVMVRELARGWTPTRAEELRLQDIAESAARGTSQVPSKRPFEEPMRHYLYFPKRPNAEEAGEWLRNRGFSVEVQKNAGGETWLALAAKIPPKTSEELDDLRNEMESLAAQFGGEYDGWEAAAQSFDPQSIVDKQEIN